MLFIYFTPPYFCLWCMLLWATDTSISVYSIYLLIDNLHGLGRREGAGLRSGPNVLTKVPRLEGFLTLQVFSASCKFGLSLCSSPTDSFTPQNFRVWNWCCPTPQGDFFIWCLCVVVGENAFLLENKGSSSLITICAALILPLDWWWSLNLFTFCQPLKWLWQEGEAVDGTEDGKRLIDNWNCLLILNVLIWMVYANVMGWWDAQGTFLFRCWDKLIYYWRL